MATKKESYIIHAGVNALVYGGIAAGVCKLIKKDTTTTKKAVVMVGGLAAASSAVQVYRHNEMLEEMDARYQAAQAHQSMVNNTINQEAAETAIQDAVQQANDVMNAIIAM